jgi:hypothetical protein
MNAQMRDTQFASVADTIAHSFNEPSVAFGLGAWETFIGAVKAFFKTWEAPRGVLVRQALRGIAAV